MKIVKWFTIIAICLGIGSCGTEIISKLPLLKGDTVAINNANNTFVILGFMFVVLPAVLVIAKIMKKSR